MHRLFILIVFLSSLSAVSQLPDSIAQKLDAMPSDTNKVTLLNDLSKSYWKNEMGLAQSLAQQALKLSREIDWGLGECRSLNSIGVVLTNKGLFDSAMLYQDMAHKKAIEIESEKFQYFVLNSKGIIQRQTGNYESAISNYLQALEFAERIGTKIQMASIIMNIGNIHYNLDNFEKAASFYQRSLSLFEELDYNPGVEHLYNNLGDVYGKLNQFDTSLSYFNKSLETKRKTGNKRGIGTTYVNIAMLYQAMDSLQLVKDYFEKAIAHYEESGADADAVHAYYGLAELNVKLNNPALAMEQALKALTIAKAHGMKEQAKETHQLLSSIYEVQKKYELSLSNFKKYSLLKDTLFNENTASTINELEIKYESAKKEKEILAANAEIERKERYQQFLLVIIGTILLFSIVAILLLIQRFKLRRALLSQEIDTLRVQINSIFGGGIKNLNLDIDQINEGLYKPLSEREYEILTHAVSDQTNSEIADKIFVSVNTVKTHLKNIYSKLGVSNRKEALEVLLAKS